MRRMNIFTVFLLSFLPLGTFGSDVTGVFSSFKLSERSGDIVGMELHIVPNPTGHSIIIQAAEGAPAYPESYSIAIQGNEITFSLPEIAKCGLPSGAYRAKITSSALELTGPYKSWVVPRNYSFWQ